MRARSASAAMRVSSASFATMEALRSRMAASVALRARCHKAMMMTLSTLDSMSAASMPTSASILAPQLTAPLAPTTPVTAGHAGIVMASASQPSRMTREPEEGPANSGPTLKDTDQTVAATSPMTNAVTMNRQECRGLPYRITEYTMIRA